MPWVTSRTLSLVRLRGNKNFISPMRENKGLFFLTNSEIFFFFIECYFMRRTWSNIMTGKCPHEILFDASLEGKLVSQQNLPCF